MWRKKRENENISEVIRPQIFTLTLNKAKKTHKKKYATKKELKKKTRFVKHVKSTKNSTF